MLILFVKQSIYKPKYKPDYIWKHIVFTPSTNYQFYFFNAFSSFYCPGGSISGSSKKFVCFASSVYWRSVKKNVKVRHLEILKILKLLTLWQNKFRILHMLFSHCMAYKTSSTMISIWVSLCLSQKKVDCGCECLFCLLCVSFYS